MRSILTILLVFPIVFFPYAEVRSDSTASLEAPVISGLSKKTLAPFGLLKITGSGFTSSSDTIVVFSSGSYRVEVSPTQVTSTSIAVGAPVYLNPANLTPATGTVSVFVRLKSSGAQSNSVSGVRIANLPNSAYPSGSVTKQYFSDMQILLKNAVSSLTFIKTESGGAVNTGPLIAKANALQKRITSLLDAVSRTGAKSAPQGRIGAITINNLDAASLALSDRMVLGVISQLNQAMTSAAAESSVAAPEGYIPSIRDTVSRYFGTTDPKTTTFLLTALAAPVGIMAIAIYMGGATATVVPLVVGFGLAVAAFGALAYFVGVSTILKEAVSTNSDDTGEAGNTGNAMNGFPSSVTSPVYGGTIGGQIQGAISSVKGFAVQAAKNVAKAVQEPYHQKFIDAFKKMNVAGTWKGRYTASTGNGGSLDARISQTVVYFTANVTVGGFGSGRTNGAVNGANIDAGNVYTQGCTIVIYNGRLASPNAMNGQFSVTGSCLDQYGLDRVTGSWDLFRPQ